MFNLIFNLKLNIRLNQIAFTRPVILTYILPKVYKIHPANSKFVGSPNNRLIQYCRPTYNNQQIYNLFTDTI